MKNQNLPFRINLRFSLILIVFMIFKTLIYAQDTSTELQNTITINGSVKNGKLILDAPTQKSLNKQKIYTFRVVLINTSNVSDVTIKPKFSTKMTDIPDILKTYFAENGSLKANLVNGISLVPIIKEFNDIAIKGDFTSIEVNVLTNNDKKDTIRNIIEYGNRNYIKWLNFTTGFFGSNLINNSYNLSPDGMKIIKEPVSKYDISIGALANFNYVLCPFFKAGIGLGAALSPEDGKTRFLFGPSLTFGSKNEFAFSGGWAYATLTALSSTVSTNGVDFNVPYSSQLKSVPTYNKGKWRNFIGFTYSLIKK